MKLTHPVTLSRRALRALLLVGLVAGPFAACSDDPNEPNPPAGGSFVLVPNMRAEDVSADGTTVLLTDIQSPTADFYFHDVAAGTTTFQASPGDMAYDFATGISNGLRVSAIHGKPEQAGLWQQAGGWLDLGNIYPTGCEYDDVTHEQNQSGAFDIDSAGLVAVGLVWNGCNAEAFRWSNGAFTALDLLGTGIPDDSLPNVYGIPSNRATVVSDDGEIAAGFASDTATVGGITYFIDRRPAYWNANGAGTMIPSTLPEFSPDAPGEVLAISGDGSRMAGIWNLKAWTWSAAGGLVNLSGEGGGYAQAVARNGELVFGTNAAGFDPPVPFVWTQAGGVQSLLDIAAANGVTVPANYWWEAISAVSADGTVITGTVWDDMGNYNSYVLKLPATAYDM
ncbi:MAG TPA: hypothetical protein VFV65_02425 [Gemmatimonadales bacterium]|nr:hypothetical protein [Gemmatimonadales bacterium]